MKRAFPLAATLCAAAVFGCAGALAAEDHSHHQHHAPAASEKPSVVQVRIGNPLLTDQDGRQVKLRSDVFGDRLVVMDFIYTTCTTVCPVLTTIMTKVQAEVGDRLGRDVRLVSITVDPARDTAARLKEYGSKHGVKPGWTWLTGPTGIVNDTLKGFGAYAPNFEDHPPLVLVGDPVSGKWTRFVGFSDPKEIVAKLDELTAERAKAAKK